MSYHSGPKRYNMNQVIRQIEQSLFDKNFGQSLYQSTNGLSRMIIAILETNGENWTKHAVDSNGKPLFNNEDEQNEFTQKINPHLHTILGSFYPVKQSGGANVAQMMNLPKETVNNMKASVTGNSVQSGEPYDPEKVFGIDEMYTKIITASDNMNKSINDFASKYGVLYYEKQSDISTDVRIIPNLLATAISSAAGSFFPGSAQKTKEFMDKIKVPLRLIITVIYLALDVSRIAVAVQGQDAQRKTLSMLISLLEFLRGDWKKAILTFIGYFGMTPMFVGEFAKVYLTLFHTLSPTLQEQITYSALDVSKSFAIGILLAIFKVTAPEEVRLPVIGFFEKIALKKAAIDGMLIDSGLPPREDYFSPSFNDLNNLQAVIDDPEFTCSCEHQELVKQVDKYAIIHIILKLIGIDVTKKLQEVHCGAEPCKPFVEALVQSGVEKQKKLGLNHIATEEKMDVSTEPVEEKANVQSGESVVPAPVTTNQVTNSTPLPPTIENAVESAVPLPPTIPTSKNVSNAVESAVPLPPTIPTSKNVSNAVESAVPLPPTIQNTAKNTKRGGRRILHTRRRH